MKYFVLLPLLASVATAQYGGGGSGSSSSSSSSSAGSSTSTATSSTFTSTSGVVTHAVAVGQSGVTFSPSSLTAKAGEAVQFIFYPAIHSVNQATFDKPCAPANGSGFASGGFQTKAGANATTFTITINDTSPVWFYCGYADHCQLGMNGVINPPADGSQTLAQFNSAAALVVNTTRVSGVQGGIVGAAASTSSASAASTSGTAASKTSASTTSATSKPNDANELGAWIGVVAGTVGLIFAGLVL